MVDLNGLDQLVEAFKRMGARAPEAARSASRQGAALLIAQARINATGPARNNSGGRNVVIGKGDDRQRLTRFTAGGHRVALGVRDGGPGVVSGRLRNSIQIIREGQIGDTYTVEVAPTVIYSRRLELGFTGTDSLGRHYDQPPYPFFFPAVRMVNEIALPAMYGRVMRALLDP